MKVATRITVATAVVVAFASAAYAFFDLRARASERREVLEREARAVASTLRVSIEASTTAHRLPSDAQLAQLSKATSEWTVTVLPRTRASEIGNDAATSAQLRRMRALIEGTHTATAIEDERFYYDLPIRVPAATADDQIVGMLEISRSASILATTSDDLARAAALVALIVAVTTFVVGALASRLVARPIRKLLSGIDDVAKGDLSHVILSERDDEIGAIATRFNEMTFSLRESRAETQRQNEARLNLEQRVGQSEKLATIGQLAAEIAHEVGTPLNVIAGRARSIQKKKDDAGAVDKNAGIIADETARITRIIQRLLDFARRKVGSAEHTQVNLNELSLTTMELLAGQFSSARVKTRLDRAEGLPKIPGDADRLQQVLINLLLNAVQAMPDGGSLQLETKVVERARPGLETSAGVQKFVTFAVADSGTGIPPDIKDKIFDPFYTTKEGSGGTGLGLAVCSGIVKEHDGWIDIEDGESGGTVFRVYLPA